jgi:predicted solute-binding protein
MRIAKIPYLNSYPFFAAFGGDDAARVAESRAAGFDLVEMAPAQLGELARRGEIDAGLIPAVDWFALDAATSAAPYERLGDFGIAVRGRVESVILLSEKPLEDLGGARIGITEESATSVRLLRLLLEARHGVKPAAYVRGARENLDAYLVIGDEALAVTANRSPAPIVLDLAEEWEAWQELPFVFAVWVARRDLADHEKQMLAAMLDASLDGWREAPGSSLGTTSPPTHPRSAGSVASATASENVIARAAEAYTRGSSHRRALGDAGRVASYLRRFIYRLGPEEERALALFRDLLAEHAIGYTA